jgi:hypothetical protein
MSERTERVTVEELKARARAAGLTLTDSQIAEIHKGWVLVEGMADRVRRADRRPREAEPDLIFRARFED